MRLALIFAAALVAAEASASEMLAGPYTAEIVRIIDGDTFEARVHVWLGLELTTLIRLRGIDTPERHGRCPGEREAALAARDALARLLGDGPVTLTRIAHDKYAGRLDAAVQLRTGEDAATTLLAAGHAWVWRDRRAGCDER